MKGYLSGPMLGYEELNYPLFGAWAKYLRALGHEVLVPSEVPVPPKDENPIAYYMRKDLELVLQAECLWMIPGWIYSLGAKIEAVVGKAIGLPLLDARTLEELDIPRIHQVVECGHGRQLEPVEVEVELPDGSICGISCMKCSDCERYPIYDNKFRVDTI